MAVGQHLSVKLSTQGEVVVLALEGELDLASAALLERELERDEISSAPAVLLDLRDLQFIDSSGLRTLFSAHARAHQRRQRFAVTQGSPQVQRLLAITRTGDHLHVVDSPEELRGADPAA
jgi:anti-anti-sigma factor